MTWSGTIPVFINNFNRLTSLKEMVRYFDDVPGTEVVIIDNDSTYPPLLGWYAHDCPVDVINLGGNFGHHAPWTRKIVLPFHQHKQFWGSKWYVVTDPDLDISNVPKDMIDVLINGFAVWEKVRDRPCLSPLPPAVKIGLSLENSDISSEAEARLCQQRFWQAQIHPMYFLALVDTTLALYPIVTDPLTACRADPALRTNRPYTARHLPWYVDPKNLSEEDEYYYRHAGKSATWRP